MQLRELTNVNGGMVKVTRYSTNGSYRKNVVDARRYRNGVDEGMKSFEPS